MAPEIISSYTASEEGMTLIADSTRKTDAIRMCQPGDVLCYIRFTSKGRWLVYRPS